MLMHRRQRQRGASLVELMIGTAAGLTIVAGALGVFSAQLTGMRKTMLEVRVNQDLRAAADLVARDLRRAAYWQNAILGTRAIGATAATVANPYRAIASEEDSLAYQFSRDDVENNALDNPEQFGFRIGTDKSLQMQTASGVWQTLTDPNMLRLTDFSITPNETTIAIGDICPKTCAPGTPGCPSITVRSYALVLAGEAAADARIKRELRLAVRVRNDRLDGACPA